MACTAVVVAALLVHVAWGLQAVAGGAGHALFVDSQQGLYVPAFPMPTDAVTIELWTKLMPVGRLQPRVAVPRRPSCRAVAPTGHPHTTSLTCSCGACVGPPPC